MQRLQIALVRSGSKGFSKGNNSPHGVTAAIAHMMLTAFSQMRLSVCKHEAQGAGILGTWSSSHMCRYTPGSLTLTVDSISSPARLRPPINDLVALHLQQKLVRAMYERPCLHCSVC